MNFLKRQIPLVIVICVGLLTLFGHFINYEPINDFVDNDATQWFDIIAAFAIFLGALNMLKLQVLKIAYKRKNWQYSILAVSGFFFAIFAGFFFRGANYIEINDIEKNDINLVSEIIFNKTNKSTQNSIYENLLDSNKDYKIDQVFITLKEAENFMNETFIFEGKKYQLSSLVRYNIRQHPWGAHVNIEGSLFSWMFFTIFTPLSATMFALLAFFVASASYRAFRIRNFEATLLLIAGIILMLGRVPLGELIPWWAVSTSIIFGVFALISPFFKNKIIFITSLFSSIMIVFMVGLIMNWNVVTPNIFKINFLQEWIYNYPTTAGSRALMIGIALGIIGTSFRIIIGKEKSFLGD